MGTAWLRGRHQCRWHGTRPEAFYDSALQAQQLVETVWQPIGPDMLLTGYLPAAGGLWALHQRLALPAEPPLVLPAGNCAPTDVPPQGLRQQQQGASAPAPRVVKRWRAHDKKVGTCLFEEAHAWHCGATTRICSCCCQHGTSCGSHLPHLVLSANESYQCRNVAVHRSALPWPYWMALNGRRQDCSPVLQGLAEFYKPWDRYGALSNFSPHPIEVATANPGALPQRWPSVEHFYQAQKFAGSRDPAAAQLQQVMLTLFFPRLSVFLCSRSFLCFLQLS